jgi:pyruvate kinase
MRKTKIICTLGPTTEKTETLGALVHGVAVNAACRSFATALSKSAFASGRAIQ